MLRSAGGLSAGVAGWALIGCGDDDDGGSDATGTPGGGGSTSTPGATGTAPSSGTEPPAAAGGTFTWGFTNDLVHLEPHTFTGDVPANSLFQVWDNLTRYNENLEPQAHLAESWEINEDSTEFVLHLREGVTFHSGREFTSDDVLFQFDRVVNPDLPFGQLRAFAELYTYEAPDAQTLIMRTDSPKPQTFDFFEYLKIGDRDNLEDITGDPTAAGGTGQYMFQEWRPGDRLTLVKNPNYWDQSAPPLFDEQVALVSLDPNTLAAQFEAGELDGIVQPALRDFVRLGDSGYNAIVHPSGGASFYLAQNSVASGGTPIEFTDNRTRQAMAWAADRGRFASSVLLDTVGPSSIPWPSNSPAYDEAKNNHYSYNLEEAKKLLDAVGIESLSVRNLTFPGVPEMHEWAQIFQEDLRTLGITMEIDIKETADFVNTINADPPGYNGFAMFNSERANLSPSTMVNLGSVLWSPMLSGEFEGRQYGDNNTGYYSERYTQIMADMNSTGDQERLLSLYQDFNDVLLEDVWLTPLSPRPKTVVLQEKVQGATHWPGIGAFDLRKAHFA